MSTLDATSDSISSQIKTVAFQGAPGCFSHLAGHLFCKDRLPKLDQITNQKTADIKYTPHQTYDEVVKAVLEGTANFGVLPLENSSVGTMTRSFELITNNQVAILSDLFMSTRHQLIGLPETDPSKIKRIISHPMALKQCRKYLSSLNKMQIRPYWDTAGACFYIKRTNDPSIAAVAGAAAAQAANLKILERDIDDQTNNATRFSIISKIDLAMGAVKTTFPDEPRLSCSVELKRQNYDLTKFLQETVAKAKGELLNVVCFPVPDTPWTYVYILEIAVNSNQETQAVWSSIRTLSNKARILGIYGSINH